MASTTSTTRSISADVMEHYRAVHERGEKPADVAKRFGITGSTVSANVKRVRGYIDAGDTLTVDGTPTGQPEQPTVDAGAIADGMVTGGSIVVATLDAADAERDARRSKLDDAVTRAQAALDAATKQRDEQLPVIDKQHATKLAAADAVATALGFDIGAWRTAVAEALNAASKPTGDGS
jgi:hypothetical protein